MTAMRQENSSRRESVLHTAMDCTWRWNLASRSGSWRQAWGSRRSRAGARSPGTERRRTRSATALPSRHHSSNLRGQQPVHYSSTDPAAPVNNVQVIHFGLSGHGKRLSVDHPARAGGRGYPAVFSFNTPRRQSVSRSTCSSTGLVTKLSQPSRKAWMHCLESRSAVVITTLTPSEP